MVGQKPPLLVDQDGFRRLMTPPDLSSDNNQSDRNRDDSNNSDRSGSSLSHSIVSVVTDDYARRTSTPDTDAGIYPSPLQNNLSCVGAPPSVDSDSERNNGNRGQNPLHRRALLNSVKRVLEFNDTPVADSASPSNRTQVSSTTTSLSGYKLQLAHPVRVKTMQDLFIVNGIPQIRTVTILIGAGVQEDDEQIEIEKTYNGKTHLLEQTTHETNENTILQAFVGKKILILERTNTVKQAEMVRNVFSMSSKMVYDEIRGTLIDGVMNDNDQMRIIFHTKTKKTVHYLLKEETFCFTFNGSDKGLSIIDSSERIDPTGKNKDERTLRNVGGSNIYTNNIDFEEKVVAGADYIEVIRSATLPFQDRDGDSLWDNMVTRCTSKRKYTSDCYEVDGSLALTEATLENTDFGDEYSQESFYDTPDTRRGTRRSSSRDRFRRRSRDSHNDTTDETLRYRGPNPTPNGGQVDSHARHRSHSRNRTIQNADLHARPRSHSRNRDNRDQNADPHARHRSHSRNRTTQNADPHARPRSHSRSRDNRNQNADPQARRRSHSRIRDNMTQTADPHARPRSHSRSRDNRDQNADLRARPRSHSRNRDSMTQTADPQVRPRSHSRNRDNMSQNAVPHARPRSHSRNRTSQNADPHARHRSHSRNRDNRSQNTTTAIYRPPMVEEMDTSEERQARRNAAPRRPRSRSRSRQSRSRSRSRSRGRHQSGTRAVRPRGPLRRPGQTEPDPSSSSSSPEQDHSPQQRGRSGRMRTGGKNPALLPPPPADSSSSGSSHHPSSSASSGSAATQPSAHNSAAVSAHFDSSGTHTPRSRGRSPFAPKNSDKSTQYEPPSSASGGRSAFASRRRSSRSRSRETRTSGTQYEALVDQPEVNVTREDARRLLALTPLHASRSPATRSKSKSPQTARRMADQFRGATTIKTKKRLGEPLWKKSPSKSKAKSPAKSPAKSKTKSPSKSLAKSPAKSATQGSPARLMRQVVTTDNLRTGSSTTQETLLTYNRGTNQPPPPTNPFVPSPNEARRLVTNVAVNLPDEANVPSSSTNPPTRTTTTHPIRLLTRINDESFEMVANFQLIHTGLPPNFRPQTIWVDGKKYWSSQEEPPVYDEEDKS